MNNNYIIITPCSRPDNLPLLYESILNAFEENTDRFLWLIVRDEDVFVEHHFTDIRVVQTLCKTDKGVAGHEQRNRALVLLKRRERSLRDILESYKDHFVYFLDDDTTMHPNFTKVLDGFTTDKTKMITFESKLTTGKTWVTATSTPKIGTVDSGSFVVKLGVIGDTEFNVKLYEADGAFAKDIADKLQPDEITVVPQVAAYYNSLR